MHDNAEKDEQAALNSHSCKKVQGRCVVRLLTAIAMKPYHVKMVLTNGAQVVNSIDFFSFWSLEWLQKIIHSYITEKALSRLHQMVQSAAVPFLFYFHYMYTHRLATPFLTGTAQILEA